MEYRDTNNGRREWEELKEGVVHAGGTARPPGAANTKGRKREVRENEGPPACTNLGAPCKASPLDR